MKFVDFKQNMKDFKVFDLRDIRKVETDFDIRRLSEWRRKGYIRQIRRRYYMFADSQVSENTLFMIANTMLKPSYISLESALSVYGLIPETVYGITSVTSAHTARFDTDLGSFSYRHIKPEFMFGYEIRAIGDDHSDVADMEKTVLDYLYFHPEMKEDADFVGWRFNSHEFKLRADMDKFKRYEAAFHSKELSKRVAAFIAYINHD
jgi:predicted transcriptional regulator of viral defense system